MLVGERSSSSSGEWRRTRVCLNESHLWRVVIVGSSQRGRSGRRDRAWRIALLIIFWEMPEDRE